MEYLPAGSLQGVRGISVHAGVKVLHHCLSALAYLNSCHNITLGNLTPAKILIERGTVTSAFPGDIKVKLGDFFTSNLCGQVNSGPNGFCSSSISYVYSAPERVSRLQTQPTCDPFQTNEELQRVRLEDVWSLGVITLELVFGFPPAAQPLRDSQDHPRWCDTLKTHLKTSIIFDGDTVKKELGSFLQQNMVANAQRQSEPCHRREAAVCKGFLEVLFSFCSFPTNPQIDTPAETPGRDIIMTDACTCQSGGTRIIKNLKRRPRKRRNSTDMACNPRPRKILKSIEH